MSATRAAAPLPPRAQGEEGAECGEDRHVGREQHRHDGAGDDRKDQGGQRGRLDRVGRRWFGRHPQRRRLDRRAEPGWAVEREESARPAETLAHGERPIVGGAAGGQLRCTGGDHDALAQFGMVGGDAVDEHLVGGSLIGVDPIASDREMATADRRIVDHDRAGAAATDRDAFLGEG